MNFFIEQQKAKERSRVFVLLFAIAVVCIVLLVNVLATAILVWTEVFVSLGLSTIDIFWWCFPKVVPVALVPVVLGCLWRWFQIGNQGDKVAEMLGGMPVPFNTQDPLKKRLLNVVEEMALASGIPTPRVYVLENESGINAFAAGTQIDNAVVGVTQGALQSLNREELQGVIAHEFSHIFYGDMRLNQHLLSWNAGILSLYTLGHLLLRAFSGGERRSSKRSGGGGGGGLLYVAFFALGLMVIGGIGLFFANLLKAAVSRQREFLADASSVQFTRNPHGIAGALSKIGQQTSGVRHPMAEEASHMFFGSLKRFHFFATHPRLEERIAKVLAIPVSQVMQKVGEPRQEMVRKPQTSPGGVIGAAPNPSHIQGSDLERAQAGLKKIEALFCFREPHQAKVLFSALIALEQQSEVRLKRISPDFLASLKSFPKDQYLDLVDLALPVLREMDPSDQAVFYLQLEEQVLEDKQVSPFELAVLALLRRHLRLAGKGEKPVKSLQSLKSEAFEILRMMSLSSQEKEASPGLRKGVEILGWSTVELERHLKAPKPKAAQLIRQLQRLGDLQPSDQEKLFKALWAVALSDNRIQAEEKQLFRALAELLQVPAPAGLFSSPTPSSR